MDAKKFSLIVLGALILGVGVWYYFGSDGKLIKNTRDRVENEGATNGFRLGANAIYVSDQIPGREVLVGFAALGEPGFVVIREVDDGTSRGIVGVSGLVPAGESGNVPPIVLSREARHGETLVAVLYRDDGDGVFNPSKDLPTTDDNNEPFAMQFMIDEDAEWGGEVNPVRSPP